VLTARIVFPLAAALAWGYDFSALKPQGYVSDFARVVDPASKADLERYCAELEKSAGVELALVTLPSLEGEPIEDVANLLHRKWGVGKKKTDEGALLLLAIRERRSRLEVGYGLEPVLPDGAAGALLREMRPALRENQYGDALILAARGLGSRIAQAKNVRVEGAPAVRNARPDAGEPWDIGAVVLFGGLLALAILFFTRRGAARRMSRHGGGMWIPPIFTGGWGGGGWGGSWSSGHGGFGGYDSSDSFGGFGGGDSGGGGASSDW
jgi:uncharacterized protein